MEYVTISEDLITKHRNITLVVDLMFTNEIPFLITMSRGVNLITEEQTPKRISSQLVTNLSKVLQIGLKACFMVRIILMDLEFEKIKQSLMLLQ